MSLPSSRKKKKKKYFVEIEKEQKNKFGVEMGISVLDMTQSYNIAQWAIYLNIYPNILF